MPLADVQQQTRFVVAQRFTMMVNRYDVTVAGPGGAPATPVCFVEQKRLALREQIDFRDPATGSPLFRVKARRVMDVGATYDVTAGDGTAIGLFRKDAVRSLLRSTWHLEQPGLPPAVGQERSMVVAVLRRVQDTIPLPFHFDFSSDGQAIMSVERTFGLRDRYLLTVHAPALDRRLAIAMAVGLDALQAR
jgi:uncharacterized protein YxjI